MFADRALEDLDLRAEVMTQDVARAPHVETTFMVEFPESGRGALVEGMRGLQQRYGDVPHASWRLQAGGGDYDWVIATDRGFPDVSQGSLFDQLAASLPPGSRLQMLDRDFVVLQVERGTDPAAVSATVERHLRLLGGPEKAFYHVESGPEVIAMMLFGECSFESDPIGRRLEADHRTKCTSMLQAQ